MEATRCMFGGSGDKQQDVLGEHNHHSNGLDFFWIQLGSWKFKMIHNHVLPSDLGLGVLFVTFSGMINVLHMGDQFGSIGRSWQKFTDYQLRKMISVEFHLVRAEFQTNFFPFHGIYKGKKKTKTRKNKTRPKIPAFRCSFHSKPLEAQRTARKTQWTRREEAKRGGRFGRFWSFGVNTSSSLFHLLSTQLINGFFRRQYIYIYI